MEEPRDKDQESSPPPLVKDWNEEIRSLIGSTTLPPRKPTQIPDDTLNEIRAGVVTTGNLSPLKEFFSRPTEFSGRITEKPVAMTTPSPFNGVVVTTESSNGVIPQKTYWNSKR